jgi:gas vesicle protein
MKLFKCLLVVLVAGAIAFTGCKKSGVDTRPIEKSFSSAEPATKSSADKVVAEIKANNYAGAMAELSKLGTEAKLTDDQKKAVTDTLEQVKEKIKAAADQATKDVKKGVEDVQKSLGK